MLSVSVNRLLILIAAILLAVVLILAAMFSNSVQRDAEDDACRDLAAYVDC
jgi:hypothetical protein